MPYNTATRKDTPAEVTASSQKIKTTHMNTQGITMLNIPVIGTSKGKNIRPMTVEALRTGSFKEIRLIKMYSYF